MMLDRLQEKGLMGENRYLTPRGKTHYRKLMAGVTTSDEIAAKTGYTAEYVRMLLAGIVPVTVPNYSILDKLEQLNSAISDADNGESRDNAGILQDNAVLS